MLISEADHVSIFQEEMKISKAHSVLLGYGLRGDFKPRLNLQEQALKHQRFKGGNFLRGNMCAVPSQELSEHTHVVCLPKIAF